MISSTSNPRVKQLIQLQKKGKERDRQDVFVAEGPNMYREAPRKMRVQTFVSEGYYQKHKALFEGDDQVIILSDSVFESASDTRTPQGVLCVVKQSHYRISDLFGNAGQVPFLIALEDLADPGNLGTIVRTAEGAGVTGILLTKGCVDLYNPKTVRSTMGAVYRMPCVTSDDFAEDLKKCREKGVRWYAADLKGEDFYDAQDYCSPTGFLIGNESRGLTGKTAEEADVRIRIPMCGEVESLNAAAAAAVLMYEGNRQRRNPAHEIR